MTGQSAVSILLVDDHPENLLALEAALAEEQYRLVKAYSGEEALKWLLKEEFAVIVLDVQMPGMDGFETARYIKALEKTKWIPIIFITAASKDEQHVFTGYSVGAIDYMVKPFAPHFLKAKIAGFVSLYQANQRLLQQTELLHQKTEELERTNRALRRTAGELTRAEAIARIIGETSIDSMITFDARGRIVTVNPAAERMFGYRGDELVGRPITLLLPTIAERENMPFSLDWMQGKYAIGKTTEVTPVRKDGTTFPAELQIGETTIEESPMYACTIGDITERKLAEHDIVAAKEAAESAAKVKSDFLATISHEIRTPLNGVMGMTDLLLESGLNSEQREYANMIRTSGETLLAVIRDILDYSKIESGKLELDEQPFDVRACIEETFQLFTAQLRERNLETSLQLDERIPPCIVGDEVRLRQVLINLIGNAVKFTESGGVSVTVAWKEGTARDAAPAADGHAFTLEFAVRDTGIGIDPEKVDRLFQPFSQLDASMSRKYGGTGLGLAICKNLVQLMGGDIRAEPADECGALFVFTIRTRRC